MKLLNLLDIQRYVRSCAAKANMSVVYEDTTTPYCTPGKVHLPNISKYTTDEQLAEYLFFVEHETAHAAHSDFEDIAFKKGTFSHRIVNMVEDYRIDNKDARWYDGFRNNREIVAPKTLKKVAEAFKAFQPKAAPEVLAEAEKYMATMAWLVKHDETSGLAVMSPDLIANSNIEAYVDKLEKFTPELYPLVSSGHTKDAVELAQRIMTEVFDHDEEDQKEDQKPQSGKGKGKEEKEEKGKGKKKDEGEGEEGEGEGQPDNKDGEPEGGEGFGNHFDHKSGGDQGNATRKNYSPTETRAIKITYGSGDWVPCLPDEYAVVRLADGEPAMDALLNRTGHTHMIGSVESGKNAIVSEVAAISTGTVDGFAQQVRRLLQIRARSRHEYGVKRGKLDQARLSRLAMRDAPGFNERVFKRKIVADTMDSAVMILLDCSGSMSGSKWAHAVKSAELINATVSRALGIPLEVLAFTDYRGGTVIYEAKLFSELRVADLELVSRLGYADAYQSGNADGEAILFAYDRLRQRKEKRKVLIVCSDGAPASSGRTTHGGGRIDLFTKQVIQDIEADPHVDIYGLGIMSTSPSLFYKQHVIVNHGDSLEQALLTLIDKSLT